MALLTKDSRAASDRARAEAARVLAEIAKGEVIDIRDLSIEAVDAAATAVESKDIAVTAANNASDSQTIAVDAKNTASSLLEVFESKWLGASETDPVVDSQGNPLTEGQIYYNLLSNSLKSYDGSNWRDQVVITGFRADEVTVNATAGQTVFNVNYSVGKIWILVNGVKLKSSDYTATNGTSITLNNSVDLDDIVTVVKFTEGTKISSLSADPVDPSDGDAIQWVSDGTGSGDVGDVMIKINVGGTVKLATLVDYSEII